MNIEEAYKILKLDNRATKNEVEIAYDVLSKNTDNVILYRSAFEFIMNELYLEKEEDKEINEEEVYEEVLDSMPEEVRECLDDVDTNDIPKKALAVWATQTVNLPLLFNGIDKLFNIFGYIRKKDLIDTIYTSACLNDIKFSEITFELTYSSIQMNETIEELRKFVKGFENIFEKELIKKFETHNTGYGIMCRCIVEKSISECIINMLKVKAKHSNCNLNLNLRS